MQNLKKSIILYSTKSLRLSAGRECWEGDRENTKGRRPWSVTDDLSGAKGFRKMEKETRAQDGGKYGGRFQTAKEINDRGRNPRIPGPLSTVQKVSKKRKGVKKKQKHQKGL